MSGSIFEGDLYQYLYDLMRNLRYDGASVR